MPTVLDNLFFGSLTISVIPGHSIISKGQNNYIVDYNIGDIDGDTLVVGAPRKMEVSSSPATLRKKY